MAGVFVLVAALILARFQISFVRNIPGAIFWSIVVAIVLGAGVVFLLRWLKERREAEAVKEGLFAQGEESAQSARANLQARS